MSNSTVKRGTSIIRHLISITLEIYPMQLPTGTDDMSSPALSVSSSQTTVCNSFAPASTSCTTNHSSSVVIQWQWASTLCLEYATQRSGDCAFHWNSSNGLISFTKWVLFQYKMHTSVICCPFREKTSVLTVIYSLQLTMDSIPLPSSRLSAYYLFYDAYHWLVGRI